MSQQNNELNVKRLKKDGIARSQSVEDDLTKL